MKKIKLAMVQFLRQSNDWKTNFSRMAQYLKNLNPVNIPESRIPLWQQLSMTRACENTIFVAMVNNTGTRYPDGRNIQGASFVAYPDGYKLRSFGPEAGVYYVDLDLDLITKVRKRWPYLEDMRQGRFVLPLP